MKKSTHPRLRHIQTHSFFSNQFLKIIFCMVLFVGTLLPFTVMATTERVSVDSAGVEGDGDSSYPSISADGRYVAFESSATNLVADVNNGDADVFVHDTTSDATEKASVNDAGVQGGNGSVRPSISADDGRFVAFRSSATNLVAGDSNGYVDIFVHDRDMNTTERISVDSAEIEGNGDSYAPSISADGRYVAFSSDASNLVAQDTNGAKDIFVRDTQLGTTERISVDSYRVEIEGTGVEGNNHSNNPSISADGRYVAFQSTASNLVTDGTNGSNHIFVHDRQEGKTTLVSVDSSGAHGGGTSDDPSISADGRYVAFWSYASNLITGDNGGAKDVFVHDTQTGNTERVSVSSAGAEGSNDSEDPSISADGRYVAFRSIAGNLVADDTNGWDIFVHDTQTGKTERVSVDSAGVQANDNSDDPSISADGHYVAFRSYASNLVDGDNNGRADVFVRTLITDTDNDGIEDDDDNCPLIANADQADLDNDGTGDVCDDDIDGDTVLNPADNCPEIANTDQGDIDTDGTGDVCDDDMDGDTVLNGTDNCPSIANTDQSDVDNNGIGDFCDGATNNDLDVFKPKHKSTVVSQNPTLYFRFDPAAEGYFVDLVGPNTDFNNCNGVIAYHGYVQRQGSDCLATAGNNVGDITNGDGNPAFPPNVAIRVCQWTPPTQLDSGHYAVSVTAFDQHTATLTSNAGIQDVLSRDQHCDGSYQDFEVSANTTIPQPVAPLMPTFGFSCDINTSVPNDGQCRPVIKGTDAGESVDTSATWMQIYVNSAGGFNLTEAWYKVKIGGAVPINKVHCTNSGGQTTCVFPDIANVLVGEQGPYNWWVRSWNAAGASAWSAAATMVE